MVLFLSCLDFFLQYTKSLQNPGVTDLDLKLLLNKIKRTG